MAYNKIHNSKACAVTSLCVDTQLSSMLKRAQAVWFVRSPADHEPCFKRFIRFISVSDVSVGFETCFIRVLCVSLVVILTLVSLNRFLCISLKLFWNMSSETLLKHFRNASITFHFCVFYVSRTPFVNGFLYCFKCVSMKHCAAYFKFHWNVPETFEWNLY